MSFLRLLRPLLVKFGLRKSGPKSSNIRIVFIRQFTTACSWRDREGSALLWKLENSKQETGTRKRMGPRGIGPRVFCILKNVLCFPSSRRLTNIETFNKLKNVFDYRPIVYTYIILANRKSGISIY